MDDSCLGRALIVPRHRQTLGGGSRPYGFTVGFGPYLAGYVLAATVFRQLVRLQPTRIQGIAVEAALVWSNEKSIRWMSAEERADTHGERKSNSVWNLCQG